LLVIKQFSKMYKQNVVINDLNASVSKPMIIGLIGDNGAGKTTLLKCIAKFIKKYDGTIETAASITSSIETPAFFENLTVAQNLKFIEKLMNRSSKKSIEQALTYVGLNNHANKKFRELSLGMKQKLVIARMMLSDSDIFLLDEPFNGLDVTAKKELLKILKRLKKDDKMLIVSSHILDELSEVSDIVWYLKDGKLIQNIDLHTTARKYNILVKSKLNNQSITDKELTQIGLELGVNLRIVSKTEKVILLKTTIFKDDICSKLNGLINKKIEVIEYYDVTNKLDDYMIGVESGGINYEDISS